MKKYQNFLSENVHCFGDKIFNIFEKACFRYELINIYFRITYSNENLQSIFSAELGKNNVYPCKLLFNYIKVGFKGVKII